MGANIDLYFMLPTKDICKGGGKSAELRNLSPSTVTRLSVTYVTELSGLFSP